MSNLHDLADHPQAAPAPSLPAVPAPAPATGLPGTPTPQQYQQYPAPQQYQTPGPAASVGLPTAPAPQNQVPPVQHVAYADPRYAPPPVATSFGNGKIIAAYVLSLLSVAFLPILFGPIAIVLANRAENEGNPKGKTAKTVAIAAMIIGFALGAIVSSIL